MKKISAFLCLLFFLSAFAGCVNTTIAPVPSESVQGTPIAAPATPRPAEEVPVSFAELRAQANGTRRGAMETEPFDITPYTPEDDTGGLLTDKEIKGLLSLNWRTNKQAYTTDEALADVDVLFRAYHAAYGPYYVQQAVFEGARQQIEAALKSYPTTTIERQAYADLISTSLAENGLRDMHLSVLNNTPSDMGTQWYVYEYDPAYSFFQDDTGYYTVTDGQAWYMAGDMERYLQPALRQDGQIVYGLVSFSPKAEEADKPTQITVQNDLGEVNLLPVNWVKSSPYQNISDNVYGYVEKHGIPVISLRSMTSTDEEIAAFFHEYDISGSDTVILDLRGNSGGSSNTADEWFFHLAGARADPNFSAAMRASALAIKADFVPSGSKDGSWLTESSAGRFLDNDKTILVLMDDNIMSAGETMIASLRTLDNVVFIGSNSRGGLIGLNRREFSLPTTGLWVTFPIGINVMEDVLMRDCMGFAPDIWVDPAYALDAVLAMADANGLSGSAYLALSPSEIKGEPGDMAKLDLVAVGADAGEIVWTSENEKIATVDAQGNVAFTGAGRATITAATADGTLRDACTVISEGADTLSDEDVQKICDLAKIVEFGFGSGAKTHGVFETRRFLKWYFAAHDGEGIDETGKYKTVSVGTVRQVMVDSFNFDPDYLGFLAEPFNQSGMFCKDGTWYFSLSQKPMVSSAELIRYEYLGDNRFEVRLHVDSEGYLATVVYIAERHGDGFFFSSIHWM